MRHGFENPDYSRVFFQAHFQLRIGRLWLWPTSKRMQREMEEAARRQREFLVREGWIT